MPVDLNQKLVCSKSRGLALLTIVQNNESLVLYFRAFCRFISLSELLCSIAQRCSSAMCYFGVFLLFNKYSYYNKYRGERSAVLQTFLFAWWPALLFLARFFFQERSADHQEKGIKE
uniref:Uncharacterized protein n=1 Tax=Tetraselmis chuii TaxID=63592 RepID=A0A6U1K310_9CHLO